MGKDQLERWAASYVQYVLSAAAVVGLTLHFDVVDGWD